MKIIITGATGLVGTALTRLLQSKGDTVVRVTRRRTDPKSTDIQWDPAAHRMDSAALEGCDAVVHLAGDPIAEGRWTPEKKARIRASRVEGTQLLAETIAKLARPPKIFLCASAIGFYGDRGQTVLDEQSEPGTGFLAETGQAWEGAAEPARREGIRVIHLRTGIVLSAQGGALAKMLPPFRLGLGGNLGSGRQYMSWITLDDLTAVIAHLLNTPALSGPVNAVVPEPITNARFTQALAKALNRPALFPVPAFGARLLFGEMADALLLSSTRVVPKQLTASGFRFQYPEIQEALNHLLQ